MSNELYNRQSTLELKKYGKVLVIGAGGIGSWVTLNLALSGCVDEIHVCDHDVIEESNLNRTPFALHHVGMKKIWAMTELVSERRRDVVVIPMDGLIQSCEVDIGKFDFIIDCTDGLMVKEWILAQKFNSYIKVGYDGWSVTVDGSKIMPWDEGGDGYRVVPSFVVPPQVLAALTVGMMLGGDVIDCVKTFDVRDIMSGRM